MAEVPATRSWVGRFATHQQPWKHGLLSRKGAALLRPGRRTHVMYKGMPLPPIWIGEMSHEKG